MSENQYHIQVKISGKYACFTRPEFKVERVSYPVITPSAARGILESIFWKPEFRYQIGKISIIKLGTTLSILRNELSDRQSTSPIVIERNRQQRTSLILKDVAYIINANLVLRPHAKDNINKYICQFKRRLEKGQCHHTPYLGTREFPAKFEPLDGNEQVLTFLQLPIGTMLFDIAYIPSQNRREIQFWYVNPNGQKNIVWGYAKPLFFNANIVNGTLSVPKVKYKELSNAEIENA